MIGKSSTLSRAATYSLQFDSSAASSPSRSKNEYDTLSDIDAKSRRQSAVSIGKKNFTARFQDDEDDDDDIHDIGIIDASEQPPAVDLWKSVDFGRSKSITAKDFDFDRNTSTTPNTISNANNGSGSSSNSSNTNRKSSNKNVANSSSSFQGARGRSKSEQEIFENIDGVEISADVYIAHEGDRNIMSLDGDDYCDSPAPPPVKSMFFANSQKPLNIDSKDNNNNSSTSQKPASPIMKSISKHGQSGYYSSFVAAPSDKKELVELQNQSDDKERDALKEQLEAMKKQNELLQVKIHETQKESESALQKERHEKMLYLKKVEDENKLLSQSLIDFRRESEMQLKKEKDDLIFAVKRMEKEKNELISHIHDTERKFNEETDRLQNDHLSYTERLKAYEKEKMDLLNQLEMNRLAVQQQQQQSSSSKLNTHNSSSNNNGNDDNHNNEEELKLIKDNEELESRIKLMEQQQDELKQSLQASEFQLQSKAELMEIEIQNGKNELQLKLERMEKEKNEMANHLLQTEAKSQAYVSNLVDQLSQEKQLIQDSLNKIEEENKQLSLQMQDTVEKQKHSTIKQSLALQQEKLVLQKQLDDILREKEILHEKLSIAEQDSEERERLEVEIVARERDELKALVKKMKDDIDAEQLQMKKLQEDTENTIQKSHKNSFRYSNNSSTDTSSNRNNSSTDTNSNSNNSSTDTNSNNDSTVILTPLIGTGASAYGMHNESNSDSNNNNNHSPNSDGITTIASNSSIGGDGAEYNTDNDNDNTTSISNKQNLTNESDAAHDMNTLLSPKSAAAANQLKSKRSSITFDESKNTLKHININNHNDDEKDDDGSGDVNSSSSKSTVKYGSAQSRQNSDNSLHVLTEQNTLHNRSMNSIMRHLSSKSLTDLLEESNIHDDDDDDGNNGNLKVPIFTKTPPISPSNHSIHNFANSSNSSSADTNKRKNSRGVDTSASLTLVQSEEEDEDAQEVAKNDKGSLEALSTQVEQEIALPLESTQAAQDMFHDLPAPHAAAARGDLKQLQILYSMDPLLLSSLDGKKRSPLFYGVAYSHSHITEYLLKLFPYLAIACDEHGDTPLHAGSSAGAIDCVHLLLNIGPIHLNTTTSNNTNDSNEIVAIDPSCRNHKQMTPAHMTASPDVLELLLSAGADLTLVDENERSPLFVACAMNRVRAADYLISCLDLQNDAALLKRDRRGDTPLHAAACNGCVDCLLLLLQYAIDPRLTNDKGLKAIDLAVKNKHGKCKDLLAEYHLHFCASSNFDSVLFFAALEGHRQAKSQNNLFNGEDNTNNTNTNDNENYEILRKLSVGPGMTLTRKTSKADAAETLKHVKSFFSLKTDSSLYLETWGDWIAFRDQVNGKVFWYNQETQEGLEIEPEAVTKMKTLPMNASMSGKMMTKKKSMRLKRTGDWIQYITPETNQTFFYNDRTREFQWTDPHSPTVSRHPSRQQLRSAANAVVVSNKVSIALNSFSNKSINGTGGMATATTTTIPYDDSSMVSDVTTVAADHRGSNHNNNTKKKTELDPMVAEVVSDWALYEDPASGSVFWYNAVTQVSQWECPFEIDPSSKSGMMDNDNYNYSSEPTVSVTHEDDLGI